ncbi:PD-(D/E)XK nuclease family protein [Cytobacillus horneckiae]|uniref:PD-(D/E)XK nuclease family protein n=1 Tax=Cytobacillus horneckiae TaxID=549687 RepID=UPI002DB7420E|nr:PD-(D/E)XK nuclease family protein [Cytobacillus horneckiae]MEC1157833.1 PD-(D/E)XK nuclease family protein [Cytobacillus horneckiae]MED2940727.1 PD-(D/E)XK nuclease family protein [Cytobacillus horneckiae]
MGNYSTNWSLSKYKILKECELKGVFNYYLAKKGQFENSPMFLRLAWRLKHLKNMYLLLGDLVHQVIESEIKTLYETGEVLNERKIKKELNDRIDDIYNQAKNGIELWYKDPKENQMLYEIYYDGDLTNATKRLIKKKVDNCIEHFLQSKTLNDQIYTGRSKVMESEKFRSFYLEGIRVILSADLIYYDDYNDLWGIVDWKTGKESAFDPVQLSIYGMYVEARYGAKISDIIVTNEYLETGNSKSYIVDSSEINQVKTLVKQSVERIMKLEANLGIRSDEMMDVFQKTENQNVCERCNFKAICLGNYRDKYINKFLTGIGKKGAGKEVKKGDIELMRELVHSGMPVDYEVEGFLEESLYATEESYTYKSERFSEFLSRH